MKRYTCALSLLAAVVVAFALPSTAFAADIYHFRGANASAEFYSYDPATCMTTSVWVYVGESRSKTSPGPMTGIAWVDLSIYHYNYCTYETSCLYGSAALPDEAFRMIGNFASATLNTTVEVVECYTGAPQAVPVALTWTGEGDVAQVNNHTSYHFPGYRYTYRQHGQSRSAQVSGSVTVGGMNFTKGASAYGYLSSSNTGTVFINR